MSEAIQYKITHYPRNRKGEPLDMDPVIFITDTIVENQDKSMVPYRAFDDSVWYGVLSEEIEELNETIAMKLDTGCKICDD